MNTTTPETYMTDALGPLPFCPGCGHTLLIKALDKALVKLGRPPKEIVIVTDIGCIGLSDRYFTTNAFHGLHGRSITYACGLKLARPELTVIALKGDGACGIGGTHLLNVARRNIGITLIIGNNLNYGMTGGQHSVTTPAGGITSTTPWGNMERPMDLCGTAIAAGAAWAHRATVFDKELPNTIADAITHPGFSMIDAWELCTAHYMPRNDFKKKDLLELADELGLPFGQLINEPRLEYSEAYAKLFEGGKHLLPQPPTIETRCEHNIKRQTGIVVAGSAGQKIRSAASIFAKAAMSAGLEATQKDDYPITVLTGHSIAEIIISPETIHYTAIDSPDSFLLISADGLKRTRARIEQLPESCTLYADDRLTLPETKARIVPLNLKDVNKLCVPTAALSAMLTDTHIFPGEALADAFRAFTSSKIADVNLKALEEGAALMNQAV